MTEKNQANRPCINSKLGIFLKEAKNIFKMFEIGDWSYGTQVH